MKEIDKQVVRIAAVLQEVHLQRVEAAKDAARLIRANLLDAIQPDFEAIARELLDAEIAKAAGDALFVRLSKQQGTLG